MPQLRLTAKIAKELKVNELTIPSITTTLYDDWYLDVSRILRKKVFIFVHIRTRIAFAIPSYEIGGTQNLLECFPLLVRELFDKLDYEKISMEAYNFFNVPPTEISFTKTDDKSTLRYVSDFKHILEFNALKKNNINQVLCDSTSTNWLNHLTKDPMNSKDYTTPLRLIQNLFGKNDN